MRSNDEPQVLDGSGCPPLPATMTLGEMIHTVNRKHAEIRQLDRAIQAKMAAANKALAQRGTDVP